MSDKTYLVWIEMNGQFKTGYEIAPFIGPFARVEPDSITIAGSKDGVYNGIYLFDVQKGDDGIFYKHETENYWITQKTVEAMSYWGITNIKEIPTAVIDFLYATASNVTLVSNPNFVGQGTEAGVTATSVYDNDFEQSIPNVIWTGKSGWWYFKYNPQKKIVGHIMKDTPMPESDGIIPFVITPDDENISLLPILDSHVKEIHSVTSLAFTRNTISGEITYKDASGDPVFKLTPISNGTGRSRTEI